MSTTRPSGGGGGGGGRQDDPSNTTVIDLATTLRFPDDFAEFQARADSGGSTYGLLKRHAFAHSSLRERPTTTATGATGATGAGATGASSTGLQRPAQRQRSKSLIPSAESRLKSLADEKTLIKALCEQTTAAASRDGSTGDRGGGGGSSSLLPPVQTVDYRRRSTSAALTLASATGGHDPAAAAAAVKRGSYVTAITSSADHQHALGLQGPVQRPHLVLEPATDSCIQGDGGMHGASVPFCRRRSFSVTPRGGLVNEGDEVIPVIPSEAAEFFLMQTAASASRRSSYNSCDGEGEGGGHVTPPGDAPHIHRVLMLGGPGVGKTALTQQFITSEFMAAQNTSFDDGREITVPVLLDGEESIMEFVDLPYSGELDAWRDYDVDGYIIVYSITDRRSLQKASDVLTAIKDIWTNSRPVILVANKSDLERSRMIGKEEGKCLAQNNDCKYIEVSAILNHKVDDLLVGMLKQIRLCLRRRRKKSTLTTDPSNPTIDIEIVSSSSTSGECTGGSEGQSFGCLSKKKSSCSRNGMFAKFFRGTRKISSKSCENLLTS